MYAMDRAAFLSNIIYSTDTVLIIRLTIKLAIQYNIEIYVFMSSPHPG